MQNAAKKNKEQGNKEEKTKNKLQNAWRKFGNNNNNLHKSSFTVDPFSRSPSLSLGGFSLALFSCNSCAKVAGEYD